MQTTIPEGHYNKSQLSKALGIGTSTLQLIAQDDEFPEPSGYYLSENCSRRTYPYWNLQHVKCWMEGVTFEPIERKTTMPGPRLEQAPPWAVPAHSRQEQKQCLSFRQMFQLMSGNAVNTVERV